MIRQWLLNRETAKAAGASGAVSGSAQVIPPFRNRGTEVTRLESFSDAVFAFAITLLVVSLQPPNTFADLITDLQRLPAFAASFFMLIFIWSSHRIFFHRYGLQDAPIFLLNTILLFVVLFYVYPLRFVFEVAFDGIFGFANPNKLISMRDTSVLYILYGVGYVAVFVLFILFYAYAYRLHDTLDLTPLERYDTISMIWRNIALCLVGVLSVALAVAHIGLAWGAPGIVYFLIAPLQILVGVLRGRGRRPLEAQARQQASEKAEGQAPVQAVSATYQE